MTRVAAWLLLLVLPVLLNANPLAAASCPTSKHKPRPYAGEVPLPNPYDVNFSYIADVEIPPDCRITDTKCIINMHEDNPLWVRWAAAEIYHDTPWNLLEPDIPALRSREVPGYEPSPDINAPIEYTQTPVTQPATIYHPKSDPTECADRFSFDSKIQSGVRRRNGEVTNISISLYAYQDGDAYNEVYYEPTDLTIAIDQISHALDFESIQRTHELLSEYGAEWSINTIRSIVSAEQHQYLPDQVLERIVFVVSGAEGKFVLPVDRERSPKAQDAFIAAIDREGLVLATGIVTIFVPQ